MLLLEGARRAFHSSRRPTPQVVDAGREEKFERQTPVVPASHPWSGMTKAMWSELNLVTARELLDVAVSENRRLDELVCDAQRSSEWLSEDQQEHLEARAAERLLELYIEGDKHPWVVVGGFGSQERLYDLLGGQWRCSDGCDLPQTYYEGRDLYINNLAEVVERHVLARRVAKGADDIDLDSVVREAFYVMYGSKRLEMDLRQRVVFIEELARTFSTNADVIKQAMQTWIFDNSDRARVAPNTAQFEFLVRRSEVRDPASIGEESAYAQGS